MLEEIIGLEKERISAFENRDAVRYFELCNELGIKPEAEELYEVGQLEIKLRDDNFLKKECPQKKISRKRKFSKTTYKTFIDEVNKERINYNNIFTHTEHKIKLLKKYFGYSNLYA